MSKVLVVGGNGMLGSMVVRHLVNKGHDVTFTVRNDLPRWMPLQKKVSCFKFKFGQRIPDLTGYDWVINCAGIIKQKSQEPFDLYSVNSVLPWQLLVACQKVGAKLIHVSSDCVFSGKSTEPYLAGAEMDAEDNYGMSKMLGEATGAIVIRTSIIGPAETADGLFEWFMFNHDKKCFGFKNHMWSGVTTLFLAEFIEGLMTNPTVEIPETGGLIQLASPPVTKFQLLSNIKNVWNKQMEIVETNASEAVNRVLLPTVAMAPEIHEQLVLLKIWMENNP